MTRSFIFQHPLIKLTIFRYTSIQHHQVNMMMVHLMMLYSSPDDAVWMYSEILLILSMDVER